MYCHKCGSNNADDALRCANCGETLKQINLDKQQPEQNEPVNQYTPVNEPMQSNPGNYGMGAEPTPNVPNYLVQSILLTVFSVVCCCFVGLTIFALPFAIIALVNSTQVNSKLRMGDYSGATESSNKAKKWCWISLWVFIGTFIAGVILWIILQATGAMDDFWDYSNRSYEYRYDFD